VGTVPSSGVPGSHAPGRVPNLVPDHLNLFVAGTSHTSHPGAPAGFAVPQPPPQQQQQQHHNQHQYQYPYQQQYQYQYQQQQQQQQQPWQHGQQQDVEMDDGHPYGGQPFHHYYQQQQQLSRQRRRRQQRDQQRRP